jgi:hypothetical protein
MKNKNTPSCPSCFVCHEGYSTAVSAFYRTGRWEFFYEGRLIGHSQTLDVLDAIKDMTKI